MEFILTFLVINSNRKPYYRKLYSRLYYQKYEIFLINKKNIYIYINYFDYNLLSCVMLENLKIKMMKVGIKIVIISVKKYIHIFYTNYIEQ